MKRPVSMLLASLVLSVSFTALADPSLADRETARSLMDDGDAKREKNDVRGALKSYEAADALMHVPTTALEVARAQAQLGMLLEARETLGRLQHSPVKPGEPPPFTAARRSADQLASELAARLPSITVAVTNPDPTQTVQVLVDGDTIPPAAAHVPRKVNPGPHTVVARAGALESKEDVTVVERENKTVTLVLKAAPGAEPVKVTPLAPPPEPTTPAATDSPSHLPKILVFGGFGLAAVGVGVGTVTGLLSISKVHDVKQSCTDNQCPTSKQGDLDSARSLGTVSTIAFIAGGVGVAAGVVGVLLSGRESATTTSTARVTLVTDVGPTFVGAHGTF